MSEIETLDLKNLSEKASFKVLTGDATKEINYQIQVIKPGVRPICEITQTDYLGRITAGPTVAILEGTGIWTTPDQNPTQNGDWLFRDPYQARAMSIFHGRLSVGGILIVRNPQKLDDLIYLEPPCTQIINETSALNSL